MGTHTTIRGHSAPTLPAAIQSTFRRLPEKSERRRETGHHGGSQPRKGRAVTTCSPVGPAESSQLSAQEEGKALLARA